MFLCILTNNCSTVVLIILDFSGEISASGNILEQKLLSRQNRK